MSGIVIAIPDIPVTIMLDQLTLIHLNIQQKVSICTSSFWIGLDIQICEGKHPVTEKCAHICYLSNISHFNKQVCTTRHWGDMNVQDIPMDIKYGPDSNLCTTSHEIEKKNGYSKPYTLKFGLNIRFHIRQNLFIIKL